MKRKNRFLALLLAVCLFVTGISSVSFAANPPSAMTVAELASASAGVKSAVNKVILSGTKGSDGVYAGIVAPATITVGSYAMGIEDYTFMAAQAILLINEGKAGTTQIAYEDVALTERAAIGDAVTSINAGQILNLAERVANYGGAMGELATSHNRPTDGTNIFEGRICIYTIAEAFATTLANYASKGALATSVTITPSSYTTSATTDPEDTTKPSEPTTPSDPTTPSTPTTPSVPGEDWFAAVVAAAVETEAYVLKNKDLPTNFTVLGQTYTRAQFFYITAKAVVAINDGTTSVKPEIPTLKEPENPQETVSPASVALTETVDLAQRAANFCLNNGQAPNFMNSSLGGIHYLESIYFFCKNLSFYNDEGRLPNTCGVNMWAITSGNYVAGSATFGADYSAYAAYLVPTANCQSTNATIISVAKTGMNYNGGKSWGSTPTNTYQAMWNLFEYLNVKTSYCNPMYYDTLKGALGTWTSKIGNCCDMAHLFNACARSLGVPARYRHGYCIFSSGLATGHVWAEPYCGSSYGWMTADLVSNSNYLGYKTSRTSYYKAADKVASLPF